MQSRRPSLLARWWLPLSLAAVVVVLGAAKLSVRSIATGQPVIPGVAGAPVLGPAPTPTPTPSPGRVGIRVHVTDSAGQPVSQALVEVRDRFNSAVGSQETGSTGDAFLTVPPNPAYVITARKPGFAQGRADGIEIVAPPTPTPAPAAAGGPPDAAGGPGPRQGGLGRFAAKLVEIQLGAAPTDAAGSVAAATGGIARLYVGHTTPRISLVDATSDLLLKHSDALGQGRQTLLAVNKAQDRLFSAWSGSQDVFVLNGTELTVERQTPIGTGGTITSLAVNPQDGSLWVSTTSPDAADVGILAQLDAGAQQVLRKFNVGTAVFGMRFRADGSSLLAPQRTSSTMSLVDPASGQVTNVLRLSQWPTDFALSPDGASMYVVNIGADRLVEVDANTGQQRRALDIGTGANGIVLLPGGQQALVLNQLLGYVQVVDIAGWQVADLIPVGRAPQAMTLSADARTLFVANAGSGSISVVDVDKHTVRDTMNIGGAPSSLLLLKG